MKLNSRTIINGVIVAVIGAAAVWALKRAGNAAGVLPAANTPGTGPSFVPQAPQGVEDPIAI